MKTYWRGREPEDDERLSVAPTIVGGSPRPVARLHEPKIKGVSGAQTSGATLVSFNQTAFDSYDKDQGGNAPVSVEDAFKYCTALNRLTADRRRRVCMADTTLVFWTDLPTPFESELLPMFTGVTNAEESATIEELRRDLNTLRRGLRTRGVDADTPFYILGLAPNAARLSVRMWVATTLSGIAEHVIRHLDDLELEPMPEGIDLSIRRLVNETAPPRLGWASEDDIPPTLAGAVLRTALTGGRYPQALLASVIRRARTEGLADSETRKDWSNAQHRRCALIKACINRDARLAGREETVPVSLNEDHPQPAYHLGRLFAALERIQTDALGRDLNSTIKDRYFGAASSTPASVFPRLLRMHQHHISKLDGGLRVVREKLVQQVVDHLQAFPPHLSLEAQGLFAVGYYHQRHALFTKKDDQSTFDSVA